MAGVDGMPKARATSRNVTNGQLQTNGTPHHDATVQIIDIRRDREQQSLLVEIHKGLRQTPKTLPTLLLYDEKGLKLFEEITYLDQYYLTNEEIEVLERHANDIAAQLKPGSVLVELGSGNLRKVNILLRAIDRLGKDVDYFALDVSLSELERTLQAVPPGTFEHVRCYGLWGTYDDAIPWLDSPPVKNRPKFIMSLGSSIGNFTPPEAAEFLRGFAKSLQNGDALLVGIDSCKSPEKVYSAYNDDGQVTRNFTLNGLVHANALIGKEAFDLAVWDFKNHFNVAGGRNEAFVFPKEDTIVEGITIKANELVKIEQSCKYSPKEIAALWEAVNLFEERSWCSSDGDYAIHMVTSNSYAFPLNPAAYAASPVPAWDEWQELWQLWDTVTRQMIPEDELLSKPIKLRNACIFYLGHIPTFFDMKLSEATGTKLTEPEYFSKIFERGIDPDVDNPELCHAHSAIPDDWPPLDEMLEYQKRVRSRVKALYDSGLAEKDPNAGRALWLGFEHEGMHLETLLYMLLQSNKTLPPKHAPKPDFEAMAAKAKGEAVGNEWFTIPKSTLVLGLNDPEPDDGSRRYYGWDVEKPPRTINVHSFKAKARPITNGEYAKYLHEKGLTNIPASWAEMPSEQTNGATDFTSFIDSKGVRTIYGPVPLKYALDWPVSASYDELSSCATYMGGRIPTLEEVRSIYHSATQQRKVIENSLGRRIPAVNAHLSNEGVEETPPPNGAVNGTAVNGCVFNGDKKGEIDPHTMHASLEGCNIGFKNWHPTPVTQQGNTLGGQGAMGGLWEWTSTPLEPHEGYSPMPLYPAYSKDFFDNKHNIVLGGSWATIPRIAGRKTFVNWYQRNYPYVWAGARLVCDL